MEPPEAIAHFEDEASSDDEPAHFGRFVRREMLPFLPYVETARKQRNAPAHKKMSELDAPELEVVKNWIKICDATHQGHCSTPRDPHRAPESGPLWLIDVGNGCIVPTLQNAKYIALSYVWGLNSSSTECTTVSNLERLQQRGALWQPHMEISPTIAQAMELTHDLGVQFLWVDKLCIVQDDPTPTKRHQLDSMAAIYAGAFITIVGAQGDDVNSGLYHAKARDNPLKSIFLNALKSWRHKKLAKLISMKVQKQPEDVESWKHSGIMEWYSLRLLDTKWASRGWTLQEQLFSRRKVIFQNNTVNWECHCACWHEGQGLFDQAGQGPCSMLPHYSLVNPKPFPDMYRFARLVSRYNQRTLTFPGDAIDAFAGVLSDLSRVFPGGFIAGLPVFCFDAALLWQPWAPMSRRLSSPESLGGTETLPSWSWAGWHGDVNSESLRSAYGYMRGNVDEFAGGDFFPSSWFTYPTVSWFSSDTLDVQGTPVGRLLADNVAEEAQREDFSPLDGWEKLRCPRSARFYYRRGPTGDGVWYPIPHVEKYWSPRIVDRSRYLHCRTRRAFLRMGSEFRHLSSACKAIDLVAPDSDERIGALRLNQAWDYGAVPQDTGVLEEKCEVIELSAGSVENNITEQVSFDEWRREWCPRSSGRYEFYNVMWIERRDDDDDDVCVRKAVGRVLKNAWERIRTEEVDISIG